jgi:heat shock protein HslJ
LPKSNSGLIHRAQRGTPIAEVSAQMLNRGIRALLLAAVVCSASCSPIAPTAHPPSAAYTAALIEGTWTVNAIEPAGQARQERAAGATYTATFSDDRISTRVDCNMCGGTVSISETTLTVGEALACTRAACPTAPFEHLYTAILRGESHVALTGSSLTLSSPRGRLFFSR